MAVGEGAIVNMLSYLAVGRESTFKTYDTCTAGLQFLNASIKTTKESQILEQVETSRTYSQQIRTSKVIEGSIEGYASYDNDAFNYILQNALGGAITSATATTETTGGAAFEHTYEIGNFDQTYSSLCMNVRKGDSASAKIYEYNGIRINEFALSAEIDNALQFNTSFMAVDSTLTSNDVASAISTDYTPLNFVNGRVSIENSFASLTSSSFWHVNSMELTISNNLKSDSESRRIGSDVLDVLPPGMANIELTLSMRFDTTTAYDAMLNNTQLSGEFVFQGDSTLSGSNLLGEVKISCPKLYIMDAGDPEIGGPDDFLKSEVTFQVLRDDSSASGYALQAQVRNLTANYD